MKIYFTKASEYLTKNLKKSYPKIDWQEEYCEVNEDFVDDQLDNNCWGLEGITYRDRLNNAVEKKKYLCKVHSDPKNHYYRWELWEKSKRYYININSLKQLAHLQQLIGEKFILNFVKLKVNGDSPDFISGGNNHSLGRPQIENGTGHCLIYDNYIE